MKSYEQYQYTEDEIISILSEEGMDTSLVYSVNYLGNRQYEIAFETLEVEFNEENIYTDFVEAEFDFEVIGYESPAERGLGNAPGDVIPLYYITITI